MINIPLSFWAMWVIMFCGILTAFLAKVNEVNQKSPEHILWTTVLKKFLQKEWASYMMSLIITGVMAYSFHYMKQFETITANEISRWAKWIPLAVLILYVFGAISQWAFYKVLGRIQSSKTGIDTAILQKDTTKP